MRSLAVALSICALAAAGAVASYRKSLQMRSEASWLMIRGDAQAAEYAATLDSAMAETQLVTLEHRRLVLEQAHRWQRIQMLLVMVSVLAAISSYLFYLWHRLRRQLSEAEPVGSDAGQGASSTASTAPRPR
ncbi:MAG TPA: hypothetical protein VKE49_12240 [Myxococcaceae bacterium]|nr:hypothetical protein [Myxococcaceae bacterium]